MKEISKGYVLIRSLEINNEGYVYFKIKGERPQQEVEDAVRKALEKKNKFIKNYWELGEFLGITKLGHGNIQYMFKLEYTIKTADLLKGKNLYEGKPNNIWYALVQLNGEYIRENNIDLEVIKTRIKRVAEELNKEENKNSLAVAKSVYFAKEEEGKIKDLWTHSGIYDQYVIAAITFDIAIRKKGH